MAYLSSEYFVTNQDPLKTGNNHPILAPYGLFKTKNGNIAVAPASEKLCEVFLKEIGLAEILKDERFKSNDLRMKKRDQLNKIIDKKMSSHTTEFWVKKLNNSGCPAGKVFTLSETLNSNLSKDQDMVVEAMGPGNRKIKMTGFPVKLSKTPAKIFRPAPELGEHTIEILKNIKKG